MTAPRSRDIFRHEFAAAFGHVLRKARERRHLSQERLAELCDRHRTFVSLLERGQQTPSLPTLFRLAQALDIRPSVLVRRVELELERPS